MSSLERLGPSSEHAQTSHWATSRSVLSRAFWGPTSYETPFTYPGEFRFNLSEYTVVLDKPVGISIAPEPGTGRVGGGAAPCPGLPADAPSCWARCPAPLIASASWSACLGRGCQPLPDLLPAACP